MNKYVASDATKKAQSISKQFSHGHVQYGGKGLVHQLEWEKKGTPFARKPTAAFLAQIKPEQTTVSLLDGGHALFWIGSFILSLILFIILTHRAVTYFHWAAYDINATISSLDLKNLSNE